MSRFPCWRSEDFLTRKWLFAKNCFPFDEEISLKGQKCYNKKDFQKRSFLVISSFDPAKEFSSIEFFKKIYPSYLFAKLHSTLFLLSTLSFIQEALLQKDIQHCFYHDYNIAKKNFQNRNKDTGTSISNGEIWPKDIQHCFYHDCNVVKKKLWK